MTHNSYNMRKLIAMLIYVYIYAYIFMYKYFQVNGKPLPWSIGQLIHPTIIQIHPLSAISSCPSVLPPILTMLALGTPFLRLVLPAFFSPAVCPSFLSSFLLPFVFVRPSFHPLTHLFIFYTFVYPSIHPS